MFYKLVHDDDYPDVWYSSKKEHFHTVECPVFTGHIRGKRNDENLCIEIKRKKMGDFVFTAFCDWLITDRVADLFKEHQLTGYKLREVDISNKVLPYKLWEIIVVGKAKIRPESGMKEVYRCEHCDMVIHCVSNESTGIMIDENTWDGSDFFMIEENETSIFVPEKVAAMINKLNLKGVLLVPSTEIQLGFTLTDGDQYWSKEQWKEYIEVNCEDKYKRFKSSEE